MAVFNPAENPTNDPKYGQTSQGTGVDRTFSSLFSGAGDVIDGAATVAKRHFRENISQELDAGLAIERDKNMGINDAVNAATSPPPPSDPSLQDSPAAGLEPRIAPAGVRRLGSMIERLQNAHEQNPAQNTDSYYGARLEALVRQVKARYPGWGDDVDEIIKQKTGIDPANYLRRALQSDIEKASARSQSQADRWENYLRQHGDILSKLPGYRNMPQQVVEDFINADRGYDLRIRQAQSAISLEQAQNTVNTQNTKRQATIIANNYVDRALNTALTNALPNGSSIDQIFKDWHEKGIRPNEQQLKSLQSALNSMELSIGTGLENVANSPLDPSGKSNASIKSTIGDNEWKQVAEGAQRKIAMWKDAITNEKTGILQSMSNDVKISKDATLSHLYKDQNFRNAVAFKEAGLDALYMNIVQGTPAFSQLVKLVTGTEVGTTMTAPDAPTLNQMQKKTVDAGVASPEMERARVFTHVALLTNAQTPTEVAAKAARVMFNPETSQFIGRFKPADQLAVFEAMGTKAVSDVMKKVRDSGDLKTWYDYKDYTMKTARNLLGGAIADANNIAQRGDLAAIRFDEKSGRFVAEPKTGTGFNPLGTDAFARTAVDPVNRIIEVLRPIAEAEGGDVNTAVASMLHDIGYRPGSSTGLLGKLGQATDAVKVEDNNPGATAKPEERQTGSLEFSANSPNPLARLVHKAESGGNYNAFWGIGQANTDLSKFTLNDIRQMQRDRVASGAESGAVGAYQIIGRTLEGLSRRLKLTGQEKFTPELQDRLANELFKDAGADKYLAGEMTANQFMDNLSRVWAGIPNHTGRSTYEGVGSNRATVSVSEVMRALSEYAQEKGSSATPFGVKG